MLKQVDGVADKVQTFCSTWFGHICILLQRRQAALSIDVEISYNRLQKADSSSLKKVSTGK